MKHVVLATGLAIRDDGAQTRLLLVASRYANPRTAFVESSRRPATPRRTVCAKPSKREML